MYWPLGAPRVYGIPGEVAPKAKKEKKKPLSEKPLLEETLLEKSLDTDEALVDLCVGRSQALFATITASTLCLWQVHPVVLLTKLIRSDSSLDSYGNNASVLIRPDQAVITVRTSSNFLILYNVRPDPTERVYQQVRTDDRARKSTVGGQRAIEKAKMGQRAMFLQFRMIIKIDAGIEKAIALEDELVVSTTKPAAVQCIRWETDRNTSQTNTELISRLPWMPKKEAICEMVYDRSMRIYIWITVEGAAFAVQKLPESAPRSERQGRIFRGFQLHVPKDDGMKAKMAAVNARFSLLAIGCANGLIYVYTARDYSGNLQLSHTLKTPSGLEPSGDLTCLKYSPDGYCLFAGFEYGWAMWSAYGKFGGSSFGADREGSIEDDEQWLLGIKNADWISGGGQIVMITPGDHRIWILDTARSSMTGWLGTASTSRMMLITDLDVRIGRGHDTGDITALAMDASQWNHIQIPQTFLERQRPLRCAVLSSDGRYLAVAGRRGLAHYSVQSGRWKTFDNPQAENKFAVKGGMCWYQHILIVSVETEDSCEIRGYSRETSLNDTAPIFVETLQAPVVVIAPIGDDSLLVYTHDNTLSHYIVYASGNGLQIIQVGQIGLNGIVRAPARVRAVTWFIPEPQMRDGDPSQDVVHATVVFLVDAKLVLLQPSKDEKGDTRYNMKVIADNVEFFSFMRDQHTSQLTHSSDESIRGRDGTASDEQFAAGGLSDSFWYFDGTNIYCWPNFQDFLDSVVNEEAKDDHQPIAISTDFYPLAIVLKKGVALGLEPELSQRQGLKMANFRFIVRTSLYLPALLRHFITGGEASAALHACHYYEKLPYFAHALEVLLHTVLDEDVDAKTPASKNALASVVSFLSSFPEFLDIVVQCTRKTEVRLWKTLFSHLPPAEELFRESLQRDQLKTAGGYLLVLHTLEESNSSSDQAISLLKRAKQAQDWELCKELARFLMALDPTGNVLKEAMERVEYEPPSPIPLNGLSIDDGQLQTPRVRIEGLPTYGLATNGESSLASSPGASSESHSRYEAASDYFTNPNPRQH